MQTPQYLRFILSIYQQAHVMVAAAVGYHP